MKKVLHIIDNMNEGGAQRVVFDYLERKNSLQNYKLEFVSLSAPTNSIYDNYIKQNKLSFSYLNCKQTTIKVKFLQKLIGLVKRNFAIWSFIKSREVDAIHTHITSVFMYMIVTFILFKGEKFHTMHSDPYSFSYNLVCIFKFIFRFFNVHPVAVSKVQREKAMLRYRLSACDLLCNSVDITYIQNSIRGISKNILCKKYNIPQNSFIIGSVGRLHHVKNYDGLIKIFSEYRKSVSRSVCLVIAGEGEEREKLINLARELGVEDLVFLLGKINVNCIYEIYKMLDLFVMTSHTEAAPMVFLEAQAVGVRCVVAGSVDSSMVYKENVQCMKTNASISDWCKAISDTRYINRKICSSKNFDVNTVMVRLEKIYDNYLKN